MDDLSEKVHQKKMSFCSLARLITCNVCSLGGQGDCKCEKLGFSLGPNPISKKTLVFDLDDTLVHTSLTPPCQYDFTISFASDEQEEPLQVYVQIRPGTRRMLKMLQKDFEIVFFTSASQEYADSIIDFIAPYVPRTHRFYRCDCTSYSEFYVKDLSRFDRQLESMILIDNSPISSAFQPRNALMVTSWNGNKNDRDLLKVIMPKIRQLKDISDVRTELQK